MSFELEIPRAVRQMLAIVLLLVPLFVLATALWSFASDAMQHRERIALLKREKAEYKAILQMRPQWDGQLARLRHGLTAGRLLYAGKTVDGDAKKMQARIAALLNAAGFTAVQDNITIGTSGADGPTQIHDSVSVSGTMAQLRTALYQLKLSRPFLFAERLTIRAADANASGRLLIELQILGFTSPS